MRTVNSNVYVAESGAKFLWRPKGNQSEDLCGEQGPSRRGMVSEVHNAHFPKLQLFAVDRSYRGIIV